LNNSISRRNERPKVIAKKKDQGASKSPRKRLPPTPRIRPKQSAPKTINFNDELNNYATLRNRNRSTTSPPILMTQNRSEAPVVINLVEDEDNELEEGEIVDDTNIDSFVNLIEESFSVLQESRKIKDLKFTPEKSSSNLFYEDKSLNNLAPSKVPLYNQPELKERESIEDSPEVICLDATRSFSDDSVIFVSHEKPTVPSPPKFNKSLLNANDKSKSRRRQKVLKWKEKKDRECALKNNALPQPSTSKAKNAPNRTSSPKAKEKRIILVDGSNVAISYANDVHCKNSRIFSAEGTPVSLLIFFKFYTKIYSHIVGLEKSLTYFEKLGFRVKAVVPEHRLRFDNSTNHTLMQKLEKSGKLILTPSKSYDDRILLESALRLDAAIVSNDFFRKCTLVI
jgi:Zc3h12a-like Ribonuclease NYN domain